MTCILSLRDVYDELDHIGNKTCPDPDGRIQWYILHVFYSV